MTKKLTAGKFLRFKLERVPNRKELEIWFGILEFYGAFESEDFIEDIGLCWQTALDDRIFVKCAYCGRYILEDEIYNEIDEQLVCSMWCERQLSLSMQYI